MTYVSYAYYRQRFSTRKKAIAMLMSKKNNHVDVASIEVRRLAREQQMVDLYKMNEQQSTRHNSVKGKRSTNESV